MSRQCYSEPGVGCQGCRQCHDQLCPAHPGHRRHLQIEKLADYLLTTAIALALAWGAVEYLTT
jgi:hypothetical protein